MANEIHVPDAHCEEEARVLTLEKLMNQIARDKRAGLRTVLTNGCFDILHIGHVKYLQAAKSFGDRLIVGINSDCSVTRLKGESRPVVHQLDRAELVASLRSVDYVTIFEEDTAEELVRAIRPDVYVKGADYTVDNCPEARIVAEYGGKAQFVQLIPGRSTTELVRKLVAL
jgi:rfaE bifunctional protein nucleotidyltransferase chain/domain